jgi:mannose-1-phosphate guanylyltransferase
MKAFLLAAGHGTRLKPLTDTIPKCLLPIRGVPMLEIWLSLCRRSGIHEVLLNLHSHAVQVREFLDRRKIADMRVRLVEEAQLLGSAGTLNANRGWVEKEKCFWVFFADVLVSGDLESMLHFHLARNPMATIGVYSVPDPSRCGIVEVGLDGWVRKFEEKPMRATSNLAFSGIMIGTPAMLDAIPPTTPVDLGFHLLPALVGNMLAYPLREYVLDIGTPENYKFAQHSWPGNSRTPGTWMENSCRTFEP